MKLPWIGHVTQVDGESFWVVFPQDDGPDLEAEIELANHNVLFDHVPKLGSYIELTEEAKVRPYYVGVWTQEEIDAAKTKAKEWVKLFNWENEL